MARQRFILAALVASITLNGCQLKGAADMAEAPADCAQRWADQLGQIIDVTAMDPSQRLFPTYTYDVTGLDQEKLRDWIGLDVPVRAGDPPMPFTIGGNQRLYDEWLSRSVGEKGAYFENADVQVIRQRGRPVSASELAVQGCAISADNVRLVRIDYDFRGFGEGGEDASPAASFSVTSSTQD